MTGAYSELSQICKMELFANSVNGFQPSTIFVKSFNALMMKCSYLNADMFQEITLNKYPKFSKKKRQHCQCNEKNI